MMNKKLITGLVLIASVLTSCNQAAEKIKEETTSIVSQTSDKVQKVIDDLGLVYVQEGAQGHYNL